MLLSVAFLPPTSVLEELNAIIDAAGCRPGDLDRVPVPAMQISVVAFGNVTSGDMAKIVSALTRLVSQWSPGPVLRFTGGAALEWPGDQTVWAKTDGEVEALEEVARTIAPAALRLGYAVDRRRFRPWLPLGSITETTGVDFLERLIAGLEAHQGETWEASRLSLLRTKFDASHAGAQPFEVLREFALPSP
jgi:2'-5' RNA ligase